LCALLSGPPRGLGLLLVVPVLRGLPVRGGGLLGELVRPLGRGPCLAVAQRGPALLGVRLLQRLVDRLTLCVVAVGQVALGLGVELNPCVGGVVVLAVVVLAGRRVAGGRAQDQPDAEGRRERRREYRVAFLLRHCELLHHWASPRLGEAVAAMNTGSKPG
jgi:hypothetical protein